MAKVRILSNDVNPGQWNVGDEVEMASDKKLDELVNTEKVEVLELTGKEKTEKDKWKNPALTQDQKSFAPEDEPKDEPGPNMLGTLRDKLKDGVKQGKKVKK